MQIKYFTDSTGIMVEVVEAIDAVRSRILIREHFSTYEQAWAYVHIMKRLFQ